MLRNTLPVRSGYCYLLLLIIGLYGCRSSSGNPLLAEWYFTEQTFSSLTSPSEDKVLRLYPKGVYTFFGTFGYSIGKWRYNDKANYIYLHQDTGTFPQKEMYLRTGAPPDEHLTAMLHFGALSGLDNHSRQCYLRSRQNQSAADPYSPAANWWRQPPRQPETEAAIRQRVAGYLQFLQALYTHAIQNKLEVIDDGWYPAPLQMHYANGVRMAYSTELDDWNQCFYSLEQAVKGYQCISGQLYTLRIKTGGSRFQRNLDCVEQLLRGLPNLRPDDSFGRASKGGATAP